MNDDDLDPLALADRLAQAIQDTICREIGGGLMHGFVAYVSYSDADGQMCFSFTAAPGQLVTSTAGMVDAQQILVSAQLQHQLLG